MKHREFKWISADRLKLHGYVWLPKEAPKAVMALVHGVGEHSLRYEHWAKRFVEKGYVVIAYDLRNHGLSEGARGGVSKFNNLLDDIDHFLVEIDKQLPELPVFLYGHSLGGLLTLNYVLRRKPFIKGVIATSPGLQMAEALSPKLLMMAKVLKYLVPFATVKSPLNPSHVSRNQEVVDRYVADTLVHDRVSFELIVAGLDAAEWSLVHAREFHVPLLLMHGTGDMITDYQASKRFAEKAKSVTELKLWEDAFHELHHEECADDVFNYVFNWMEKEISK